MKLESVRSIVAALDAAGVRYLVAGGLAVAAHGYLRLTKDVDLVLDLAPENVQSAFAALAPLGYRPLVPITAEQFADADLREMLVREKGMRVLALYSDEHRETPIDIFAFEPFSFGEEYARAEAKELLGAGTVRIVALPTLIRMKEDSGRRQDFVDVEHLRELEP